MECLRVDEEESPRLLRHFSLYSIELVSIGYVHSFTISSNCIRHRIRSMSFGEEWGSLLRNCTDLQNNDFLCDCDRHISLMNAYVRWEFTTTCEDCSSPKRTLCLFFSRRYRISALHISIAFPSPLINSSRIHCLSPTSSLSHFHCIHIRVTRNVRMREHDFDSDIFLSLRHSRCLTPLGWKCFRSTTKFVIGHRFHYVPLARIPF